MYSKQDSRKLKQEFWTIFGRYMLPILSAEGEKVNWINYKTGEKDIFFRMNADEKMASISIGLMHKDESLQTLYFEQFKQLKSPLQNALKEEWIWQLHKQDEHGKTISCIYTSINNVSIFNKNNWPQLISFFKQRIIALDEFWSTYEYIFKALQ